MSATRIARRTWLVALLGIAVVVAIGGFAIATSRQSVEERISAAVDSERVATISADEQNTTALVTGTAESRGAESARTDWYQTVAGTAYAQSEGLDRVTRRVEDPSGKVLESETDNVWASGDDPIQSGSAGEAAVLAAVGERAAKQDATVLEGHLVPLFGGSPDLVVQPSDAIAYVTDSMVAVPELLGDFANGKNAYLVTVVDEEGVPILVTGFTPGVGGTHGQGIAWISPDVEDDVGWGTI